jgi:hypothetical protein
MSDTSENGDRPAGEDDRSEVLVEVHENIGRDGVVVELRPGEHDLPTERDMEHLSMSEARDLFEQLRNALDDGGDWLIHRFECPDCRAVTRADRAVGCFRCGLRCAKSSKSLR